MDLCNNFSIRNNSNLRKRLLLLKIHSKNLKSNPKEIGSNPPKNTTIMVRCDTNWKNPGKSD